MMNHRIALSLGKGPKTSRKTTAAYKELLRELLRNRLPYEFVQEGICRADTCILQTAGGSFAEMNSCHEPFFTPRHSRGVPLVPVTEEALLFHKNCSKSRASSEYYADWPSVPANIFFDALRQ